MIKKITKEVKVTKLVDTVELQDLFIVDNVEFDSFEKAEQYDNRALVNEAFEKINKLEIEPDVFIYYLKDYEDLHTVVNKFQIQNYSIQQWKLPKLPAFVEVNVNLCYGTVYIEDTELVSQAHKIETFVNKVLDI